jgi:hypothetical protein
VSYTSVISAWARANRKGYGATRAENILGRREMEAMADTKIGRRKESQGGHVYAVQIYQAEEATVLAKTQSR